MGRLYVRQRKRLKLSPEPRDDNNHLWRRSERAHLPCLQRRTLHRQADKTNIVLPEIGIFNQLLRMVAQLDVQPWAAA
jgi:hypothetical protein